MSVFKRFKGKKINSKDKNWSRGTWYIWKRIGGKIIHKAVPEAQTKEQAETAERREIELLFNKKYGAQDSPTTFAQFVDATYTKYVEQNNINKKAKEFYCAELKKFFGKKLLSDITPQDCRDYQYKRQHSKTRFDQKYSPSSVNREMSTLSKIFNLACEQEILERNPTQYVKQLKEPPPRKRLLTEAQKEKLYQEVAKDVFLYRVVRLALNLPLRAGQILAIRKEDVDFERNILTVIASKGRDSRPVHLNKNAADILKELSVDVSAGHLLLVKGKPVKSFGKRWRSALVRAGINKENGTREDNFHFHDMRTWFSERLIKRGVHAKAIQGAFAHSDSSISDIYINVDPLVVDALDRLDEEVN